MNRVKSLTEIRSAFPALQRRHNGHDVAYFDGPGGTQVPTPVASAMTDYLLHHNANTHWAYPTSIETDAMLMDARQTWATFFGGKVDEVVFGNNMTTLTFHLARALGRQWKPGDEVIVTELDHHANIAPWQALARENGIVLKWLPMDTKTCQLRLDLLPSLLSSRTRLLAIGAASNIVGTVNEVTAAAELAHAAGALVFVDGVHYAPHFLPDVHALGADFFACSVYKFYGPHAGILWGRHALLQGLDLPRLEPAPSEAPESLETGTQNHEGIIGGAAAVKWLASLAGVDGNLRACLATTYHEIHERESRLFALLWEQLGKIPGLTRYGVPPGGHRTATVSFAVDGISSQQIAEGLAELGLFVSNGDFYAATVAEKLGHAKDGVVRIGAACYTTEEEIGRVVAAIADFPSER